MGYYITLNSATLPPSELLSKLGWFSLKEKRNKQKALMMFKIMNGMTPAYLEVILREVSGDRFIVLGSQDVI